MGMVQKEQATKANTDKWGYVKLQNFCPAKETIRSKKVT